ncbi:MAG: asparagine synthase (glutamine-hydrolyzing) [Magnetococcales bacterium]|nr:asparagine synthase (glutamine-hydrolyzing) [Magnetococcales bacterium]
MCGIAGLIAPGATETPLDDRLSRLLRAIHHRGPDDEGRFLRPGLALGMRRLSIIDIAGARQPLISADGNRVLFFNGEIYNFQELRTTLQQQGCRFLTRGDGETILHGYEVWGEAVLDRLNGMFAFALLDLERRGLWLARDHLGVKPLYWYHHQGEFAFCSEPAPLQALLDQPRLDSAALSRFLTWKYVASPQTLVQQIRKMPPATQGWIDLDHPGPLSAQRYWHPEPESLPADRVERVDTLLRQAVQRQKISDVPVGIFLSGGIDSGLLLWASRQGNAPPMTAYSVGFDNADFDETPLARLTAAHLGAAHHVEILPAPQPEELDQCIAAFGEPFANTSVPANFLVSRMAARHVKVVLNGSGGDELFGGYDRYFATRPPWPLALAAWCAPWLHPLLQTLPVGEGGRGWVHRGRVFLEGTLLPPDERHAAAVRLFSAPELHRLAPSLPPADNPVGEAMNASPWQEPLARAAWADINTMLADDYLTLVDRTSMAASIEARVPFLDPDLVCFALSLPDDCKIRGWRTKRLLRQLADQRLPEPVVTGRKRGFETPVACWFRGPLGEMLPQTLRNSPVGVLFEPKEVERLVWQHRSRQKDLTRPLLALYTLARWATESRIGV